MAGRSPFLDRVRDAIRVRHYSIRTEQAYLTWIRRYILFHGKRHPGEMGAAEVRSFLTDLAVERTLRLNGAGSIFFRRVALPGTREAG